MPAKQPGQQEFTFEGIPTRIVKPKQRPRNVSAALATATALNTNGGEQEAQAPTARSNGAAASHVQQELDLGF